MVVLALRLNLDRGTVLLLRVCKRAREKELTTPKLGLQRIVFGRVLYKYIYYSGGHGLHSLAATIQNPKTLDVSHQLLGRAGRRDPRQVDGFPTTARVYEFSGLIAPCPSGSAFGAIAVS